MLPLLTLLAGLAAAQPSSTSTVAEVSTAAAKTPPLRLLSESELPRFEDSFKSKAGFIKAGGKTIHYLSKLNAKYIRIADRDYGVEQLIDSIKEMSSLLKQDLTNEELDKAVKERFDVFESVGSDGQGKVVFSSYYQPMLPASLKKSAKYPYPIYKKPPDMVSVQLSDFDKKYNSDSIIGRVDKDKKVVPYFSRDQIDVHKALAGKGFEIAWLQDKFDILDLHIEGSGILKLPGGKEVLAQFAATNAHPYNSAAMLLIKAGAFTKDDISHDKVHDYFRAHPESQDWVLAQNPRYTFFKIVPLPEDGEPFGTVNESLTPSRSIAVDPAAIPMGALAFFSTTSPQADKEGKLLGQFPNSRFALCMDTGGAIKGPGRVDIYVGHGKQAAATARSQWNEGRLYILVKKVPPRER